jgi:hypothetical protein
MTLETDLERLFQIYMPNAFGRLVTVRSSGTRFVHYTSAESAVSILKSREVWMRKSSCMNDFMEVEHGLNCLYAAYRGEEAGKKFRDTLDGLFPGVSAEIAKLFDDWTPHFRTDTYIASFSEHDDAEDTFGRLSMWRAYGAHTGIAFVMNSAPFLASSDALKAYTSPVAYLTDKLFQVEFIRVADAIAKNADFIKGRGREELKGRVFEALRFAALCTKHPGFAEEREWRVVYCPTLHKSEHLIRDAQVIGGIPQPIYKIPLRDVPGEGLVGIEIPALVDRVIIGPTPYPLAVREALVELLTSAGMKDAPARVAMSDIPLRR